MKKSIKVVMLPTGLPILKGQLAILDGKTSIYSFDMKDEHPAEAQYAYVTVSQDVEPIKEGDWVIETQEGQSPAAVQIINIEYELATDIQRKIIATTDTKLLPVIDESDNMKTDNRYVGLPQVQQSFLKEYVANPDGEFEVEYCRDKESMMKNIETKGEISSWKLKLNQDNEVNIASVWYLGAFEPSRMDMDKVKSFNINSVKKKRYSREEVLLLLHDLSRHLSPNNTTIDLTDWIKDNL